MWTLYQVKKNVCCLLTVLLQLMLLLTSHVVILSSGEPGSLWSPTTSLIDQVVTEKGWAASLPAHMSYTPTCPSAALTAALKHKICFELTV